MESKLVSQIVISIRQFQDGKTLADVQFLLCGMFRCVGLEIRKCSDITGIYLHYPQARDTTPIFSPITKEVRDEIQNAVLSAYEKRVKEYNDSFR